MTNLKNYYVIMDLPLVSDIDDASTRKAGFKEGDSLRYGHILSVLSQKFYNIYSETTLSKDLWEAQGGSTVREMRG